MRISTICTHGGPFHADDVFAAATLIGALDERPQIIRSRAPEVWEQSHVVFDVGGRCEINDRGQMWLDHHQPGGAGNREGDPMRPYAAFGLVWREFGAEYVRAVVGDQLADVTVTRLVAAIDDEVVTAIDAADNGVASELSAAWRGLGVAVSGFNPTWDAQAGRSDFDRAFATALNWAGEFLKHYVQGVRSQQKAAEIVAGAVANRSNRHMLVLDHGLPWQKALLAQGAEDVIFVLYPQPDTGWMVQCVPTTLGSFESRQLLPAAWAGLRDSELQATTGVSDAVFCHKGRFIAGAKSCEGAKALAALGIIECMWCDHDA